MLRPPPPNVLELLDVLEYEGRPVLVMEFVPDCLANPVHRAPWPIWKAAQLMEKVARAVDAIHQAGHVHGLLSRDCIGLTEDGEPKVTGLASRRDPESEMGTVLGPFLAPEQLTEPFAPFRPAVDVFALGAIMYWLLTGTSPFPGATALESLEKVRTASPEKPRKLRRELPRELETICLKCLEKDPQRRYATARELAEDLAGFLSNASSQAPGQRGRRWMKWLGAVLRR